MVDFERTSACRSSSSHSGWLLVAALVAMAALAVGCATTGAAPETAGAVEQTPEEIIAEYQEAVRHDPTNADLWLILGQAYERIGRDEDAIHALESGLEVDPDNAGVLNELAWFQATTQNPAVRDPANAIAHAQRAVELSNGSDANMLDTLAEAFYANQQFDEAIEIGERALAIAPDPGPYQYQLQKFRDAKAAASGS